MSIIKISRFCRFLVKNLIHKQTDPHLENAKHLLQDKHCLLLILISTEKIKQRQELQERNVQLCMELQKLLARADILKENLDEKQEEKRKLLADQIKAQQDLQKLLDFINQFRETSISIRSASISESGSEFSKSNEE